MGIPACRKRRLNWAVSRNNRIKRVFPCRCRTGTLKNHLNLLQFKSCSSDRLRHILSGHARRRFTPGLSTHHQNINLVDPGVEVRANYRFLLFKSKYKHTEKPKIEENKSPDEEMCILFINMSWSEFPPLHFCKLFLTLNAVICLALGLT